MTSATESNRAYYQADAPGRLDYWSYMAAPRFRARTLARLAADAAPSTIADLGCGNGALLTDLAAVCAHARLVGIDLSEPQIASNRQRWPSIDWYAADLTAPADLPAALRASFDCVVASEIIEHLDDPGLLLDSASALATPGRGRLLLSTQSGPMRETERRVGHVRHFDRRSMTDLLLAHGWRPERVWNAGFPFHDASKWYANLRPDSSMERFGERAYGRRERLVCWALRQAFRLNSNRRGAQLFAIARREDAPSR